MEEWLLEKKELEHGVDGARAVPYSWIAWKQSILIIGLESLFTTVIQWLLLITMLLLVL
jgi:hypothetical protein